MSSTTLRGQLHSDRRASAPAAASMPSTRVNTHGAWSWPIGQIAGIDIRVHATFVVLLAWVALSHVLQGHGIAEAASGVAYVAAVFAIVVLHELGHALTARRFGITTRDITLLPIGGIARLERMPSDPRQEVLVAIAGPAVNVALAALFFGALLVAGAPWSPSTVSVVGGPILAKLMWTNIALALFNFIPAFPMDGGRVLRGALALRMEYVRATEIAAAIGQAIALLFGLVGLFSNPFLVFIAFFVWVGAQQEASLAHVHAALSGMHAGQAMVTRFCAIAPDDTIANALASMPNSFQDAMPVVDGTRLLGVIVRDDAVREAVAGRELAAVETILREAPTVDTTASLDDAFEKLQSSETGVVAVVRGPTLVGLLTPRTMMQAIELQRHARRAA